MSEQRTSDTSDYFTVTHDGYGSMDIQKWNGLHDDIIKKAREQLTRRGEHVRVYKAEFMAHYTLDVVEDLK